MEGATNVDFFLWYWCEGVYLSYCDAWANLVCVHAFVLHGGRCAPMGPCARGGMGIKYGRNDPEIKTLLLFLLLFSLFQSFSTGSKIKCNKDNIKSISGIGLKYRCTEAEASAMSIRSFSMYSTTRHRLYRITWSAANSVYALSYMENLSLQDQQLGGGPLGPNHAAFPPPGGPPQLPPQMFTTAAQLLDLTDSETAYLLPRALRVTEVERNSGADEK